MTKLELFNHLQIIEDKSGGFKKQSSIKKNYPEIYDELNKVDFPKNFTFIQKLWHFLQDDFEVHRCYCGNELCFRDFKTGYSKYCCKSCSCLIEHNKLTVSKAQLASRGSKSRKKAVDTVRKRNGGKFWTDEQIQHIRDSYNSNRGKIIQSIKDSYLDNTQRLEKRRKSYEKNLQLLKSMTDITPRGGKISNGELMFHQYLVNKYGNDDIYPQYFDKDRYPYACDFYVKSLDLFIEINGYWTHGGHPFNPDSQDDLAKVADAKQRCNKFYENFIYVWTDLDPRKRKCASDHELNFLEIFSSKIDEIIQQFEKYLK